MALAGKKISEKELRVLWNKQKTSSSPHRRELSESEREQFTDFMRMVSQIYPSYGRKAWEKGTWESSVNRVETGIKNRVDRLKAIGNGQVPGVAALAWKILSGRITK
jgi:DNA (cytosine-5)-methyltransferase 1